MRPQRQLERGKLDEGILILIGLCIILFVFIVPSKKLGPSPSFGSFTGTFGVGGWRTSTTPAGSNTYAAGAKGQVQSGNGSYAFQSSEEYITYRNTTNSSVDITGWMVQNAKSKRSYQIGSEVQQFQNDSALIPQATRLLSPSGYNPLEDVVLKPGEEAVLITGSMAVQTPYKIVSFKENMCSGYLQTYGTYTFYPLIENRCPGPQQEVGYETLDQGCKDFLRGFNSCHTPQFDTVDREGNVCNGCVDGRAGLTNSCVAFIKSHFGYPQCIAKHLQDPNFESNRWRIYLNHGWELWAKDHETISIFDRAGNLMSSTSY